MKLNIIEENYNKILERKDLLVEAEHSSSATPSKASVQELLAKQTKAKKENTEILSIFTHEGRSSSVFKARIWDKKEVNLIKKEETETPVEEVKETTEDAPKEEPPVEE